MESTTKYNRLLIIVFISMVVLFLLFCGGALSVTIADGGMMRSNTMNGITGSSWTAGISWMWIPSLLFFTLSIILAWVIFVKKKD